MAQVIRIPTIEQPEIDIYPPTVFTSSLERRKVGDYTVSRIWIDWPERRNVYKLSYDPGKPRFTPEGNLNTWLPSPCVPKQGDLTLFHDYLDRLFILDPTYKDWFIAWLAYPIQYPGTKLNTACIFWSRQTGTGKSMMGRIMCEVYGSTNSTVIREAELHSQFNHWADGRQFVMIEEIKGANAEKHADALKAMVTQQTVWINKKNKAQYELRDCANYYFNSNHPDALYLDPNDRRFFVHHIGNQKYPDEKWRNEFKPWADNGGYAAIHYYLMHEVDLSKPVVGGRPYSMEPYPFSPNAAAPQTAARTEMIENSRSDAETWVDELLGWPANVLQGHQWTLCTMKELWELFQSEYPRTAVKRKTFASVVRSQRKAVYADNDVQLSSGVRVKLYWVGVNSDPWLRQGDMAQIVQQYESERQNDTGN
jgi:putative DNA primase/helicase